MSLMTKLAELAHCKPKLRSVLIPVLRDAAWRRRPPRYPGFLGGRHEQAIAKGYLDAGLVDPDYARQNGRQFLSAVTGNFPFKALLEKGVAFIRDPEGNGVIAAGSESAFITYLEKAIGRNASSDYSELSMLAQEGEDWDESVRLGAIADAIEGATFTVTSVKGRTGKGYKVTMRPTLPQILRKYQT